MVLKILVVILLFFTKHMAIIHFFIFLLDAVMSTLMVFQIMSFREGKNLFLVIQLLSEFDFGHATSKPGILDHRTIKTVHIWSCSGHPVTLLSSFGDVVDT